MRTFIILGTVTCLMAIAEASSEPPKKEDVPKNINLLKTGATAKVRAQAAEDLGHIGGVRASWAADAIEPLITALAKDKEADVRKACAAARQSRTVSATRRRRGDSAPGARPAETLGRAAAQAR